METVILITVGVLVGALAVLAGALFVSSGPRR